MEHYNIHPKNPQRRILDLAVDILKNHHGICVYPTDTVYGLGAAASNQKALDRIAGLLKKNKKRLFSFLCSDLSQASRYVKIDNRAFSIVKRYTPGPFTFILPATLLVPKKLCPKRTTVGLRIPDCVVVQDLVRLLGEPLANTSIAIPGAQRGDPELIKTAIFNEVDIMLDAGQLETSTGSTIVDLTGEEPLILRQGKGVFKV